MRHLSLLLLVLLAGCGSDPSSSFDGPSAPAKACVSGQQLACACPGSPTSGAQVCRDDGTGFGPCLGCAGGDAGSGQGGQAGSGQGGQPAGGSGQGGSGQGGSGQGGQPAGGSAQGGKAQGGGGQPAGGSGQGGQPAGGSGQGGSEQAGSGQGGAAAGAGGTCAGGGAELTRVLPPILLLQDRSGSMDENGKWGAVVSGTPPTLGALSPQLEIGWLRFPEGNFDDSKESSCLLSSTPDCQALFEDGGCKDIATMPQVAIGPLSQTQAAIQTQLAGTMPLGNTPTRWAIRQAYLSLKDTPSTTGRHLILISDGVPTETAAASPPVIPYPSNLECGTREDVLADVKAMAEEPTVPVKTHVIGLPGDGSEASFLSDLAVAGQTAKAGCTPGTCYAAIAAPSPDTFKAVALAVIQQAIGCEFQAAAPLAGDPTVTVSIGAQSAGVARDPGHTTGWDYSTADQTRIVFYGLACDTIAQSPDAKVTVGSTCP
jgi:hypothetical protein